MKAVITGATGLVGSNLAVELLQEGHRVVCTARPTSKTHHLRDFDIEWVEADLRNQRSLERAFAGADVVFHCAAAVSVVQEVTPEILDANVGGTRRVLDAIRATGVPRLVHCSTVAALAASEDGKPVDEDTPYNLPRLGLGNAYALTKRESQELVLTAAKHDVDAVVVNPTYMFGPYDPKPSSGQMIVKVAQRKVPGIPRGFNNFSDVRDVCRGMIAAAEKGRRGECYILGGYNLSYREAFERIAAVVGVRPPMFTVPRRAALLVGLAGDLQQKLTGRDSPINSATVRFAYLKAGIYSCAKAERELGYTVSPLDDAIRDAHQWLLEAAMI